MQVEEQFMELMKQSLATLTEINHKLEDIEANTQAIDHQQQTLRQSVYCLQQVMENDNFIG
ncbi:hypothetical protein [Enterococcus saccharolyticus]|uniref:Uncharacterized protein n=1 Tax=Enterococcus saccharolyticus subsp. saccharolyticus ATCC 43076 TaxID=1139996 RepID=S0JS62_9ENTE|nr:hypothetical protein [Enterococcus saccharolyticus]EOT30728.1 hypothetical protein OMQ_00432 [Enterococcus saccharolyticus subsp. saccharolyticus ATCC 43076]EOT80289.1 hypothetical protein I572_00814 [Enterococcus saccharolyticus subsp. saccharolyticus ATCC 43076]OJG88918.1 hypothetical protein RV16_GL002498 [Enterococcus saccharolyticus]